MEKPEEQAAAPQIKIYFRIPGRLPSLYAHHMLVHPGENEVTLAFFEVVPPLIASDDLEALKRLEETGITAECIARITVSKARFPAFAEAMQRIASGITDKIEE